MSTDGVEKWAIGRCSANDSIEHFNMKINAIIHKYTVRTAQ